MFKGTPCIHICIYIYYICIKNMSLCNISTYACFGVDLNLFKFLCIYACIHD